MTPYPSPEPFRGPSSRLGGNAGIGNAPRSSSFDFAQSAEPVGITEEAAEDEETLAIHWGCGLPKEGALAVQPRPKVKSLPLEAAKVLQASEPFSLTSAELTQAPTRSSPANVLQCPTHSRNNQQPRERTTNSALNVKARQANEGPDVSDGNCRAHHSRYHTPNGNPKGEAPVEPGRPLADNNVGRRTH